MLRLNRGLAELYRAGPCQRRRATTAARSRVTCVAQPPRLCRIYFPLSHGSLIFRFRLGRPIPFRQYHGYCSGLRTPVSTAFVAIYSALSSKSSADRIMWSNDSSIQSEPVLFRSLLTLWDDAPLMPFMIVANRKYPSPSGNGVNSRCTSAHHYHGIQIVLFAVVVQTMIENE